MVKSWDEAGRPYNWLSENDNLEDNLQGLLATSDCCSLDKSMNSIMRLQLFSDTNGDDHTVIMSELVWNPPIIQFEDLQTVAVEGSKFRLDPSCSFSRVQASQSCIQYQIQTDCCWLRWKSDIKAYEGIVPPCPVQAASRNYYETSYVVTAIITTSLPKGVYFERNVRCQLRLKIIPAGNRYTNGVNGINATKTSRNLPELGETPNFTTLSKYPERGLPENDCDSDVEIERSRRSFANSSINLSEPKSRSCGHRKSIKSFQHFEGLHGLLPRKFSDQISASRVNKTKSEGRSNFVGKLDQKLRYTNLPKTRDYVDDQDFLSYIKEPLLRTPKRIRRSKHKRMSKHSQSEWRSRCSRSNFEANKLYLLRRKPLFSKDININEFPSTYAYSSRSNALLRKKAEKYANSTYQERRLRKSTRENVPENILRDYSSETCRGSCLQRSNNDAKCGSLSQYSEARDMVSRLDCALMNNLGSNALLYRDWDSERCFQSTKFAPPRTTQVQFHQSSSENSDEMSLGTCGSFSINNPCIPAFPKSVSMSSGSSTLASVFTKSKSVIYDRDSDHVEHIDDVGSRDHSGSSSPIQTDYVYNSDTSTDEYDAQQLPQQIIPVSESSCQVSNNLKIRNKKMIDIVESDEEENAKCLVSPNSRLTESWPRPVMAGGSTATLLGAKQEVTNNSYNDLIHELSQPQLEYGNRCDTPMVIVTHESSTPSTTSIRADTGLSQDAITRLQKEYQDNYEYFASLKACGVKSAGRHAVGNEDYGDGDGHEEEDDDDAEDKVYENIFLETDVTPVEGEIG